MKFALRLATNEEGPTVGALCRRCGFLELEAANWSDIYPFWFAALREDALVGAIQVCFGKPVGRLEFLAVDPDLGHEDRALVVRELSLAGQASLAQWGAQYFSAMVAFENKGFKKVLKRRGCVTMGSGNMLLKRIVA